MSDLHIGDIFRRPYPFIRDTYSWGDEDGGGGRLTWKPGVRPCATQYSEWSEADAMGEIILTVVDIHKPGKYPTRVFFTRRWKSPDGGEFGKGSLRITTVSVFARLCRGYSFEFEMAEKAA